MTSITETDSQAPARTKAEELREYVRVHYLEVDPRTKKEQITLPLGAVNELAERFELSKQRVSQVVKALGGASHQTRVANGQLPKKNTPAKPRPNGRRAEPEHKYAKDWTPTSGPNGDGFSVQLYRLEQPAVCYYCLREPLAYDRKTKKATPLDADWVLDLISGISGSQVKYPICTGHLGRSKLGTQALSAKG